MKFREFVRVLSEQGFIVVRQEGSHRIFRGLVNGLPQQVVVAFHRESGDIKPGTLASMIRQSGLPKKLFR